MITKRQFFTTIIIILFVNVVFIAGIITFFKQHYNKTPEDVAAVDETYDIAEVEVPEVEEDPIVEVDVDALKSEKNVPANYISIYSSLLPGSYVLDGEKSFIFGADGTYSGYFDDDHRHVEGYTFTITDDSDSLYRLTISSPNGMSSVDYFIDMTATGDVELRDVDGEEQTVLYTLVSDGSAYAGGYNADLEKSESVENSEEVEDVSDEDAAPKG